MRSNSLFFHALGYFWRNIETCALKMFQCERLFVNSTALNLSHVAILMMMISFLKCAFFRTLNFLMYIACSLNSILNAKMHGLCCENNLRRNFTGLVTAPTKNKRKRVRSETKSGGRVEESGGPGAGAAGDCEERPAPPPATAFVRGAPN